LEELIAEAGFQFLIGRIKTELEDDEDLEDLEVSIPYR